MPETTGSIDLPPVVDQLLTELPWVDIHLEQMDAAFRLAEESILHLEFQTTHKQQDLLRFHQYDLALYDRYRQAIRTVVIFGSGITAAATGLEGGSFSYRVHNIYLGEQDGEQILVGLRTQLARGRGLDEEARIDLVFLPLMRHRRPLVDVLHEAVAVARQLPVGEQRATLAALLGFGFRYLEQEQVETLVEDLMQTVTGQQLLEQNYQEGRQEGQLRAKREDILAIVAVCFASAPDVLQARLERIATLDRLSDLFTMALTATTLDDFLRAVDAA